jgi:hypothetical protein
VTISDDQHRDNVIAEVARELDPLYRLVGVLACLVPWCPVCHAEPGMTCRAIAWVEFYLLDREHQWFGHQERIQKAVELGHADREDVAAQFGSFPPRWVQELAAVADDTRERL